MVTEVERRGKGELTSAVHAAYEAALWHEIARHGPDGWPLTSWTRRWLYRAQGWSRSRLDRTLDSLASQGRIRLTQEWGVVTVFPVHTQETSDA